MKSLVVRVLALAATAPSLRAAPPARGDRGGGKPGGGDSDAARRTVLLALAPGGDASSACAAAAARAGGAVVAVYAEVLHGCAVALPSAAAAAALTTLSTDPRVLHVEEDGRAYASYSWGADRVDQCALPLRGAPTKVDGRGVRVYVVDTGLDRRHSEFAGMIHQGSGCHANEARDGRDAFDDSHGHGTHVAGTACGIDNGVARCDDLCSVRVLGHDGSGAWSDVLSGIDHVVRDCRAAFPVPPRRCVANLSLGGGASANVNRAVRDAVAAGVVMVVAAGNDARDACGASPASEPAAVTVGSTTRDDRASGFSNYGACVDVYAPGSDIVSARSGTARGTKVLSGTSMAGPHVAGIAAGLLREDPAADVPSRLGANAQLLAARAQQGNRMYLANAVPGGCGIARPTPQPTPFPTPVPTAAPTPCVDVVVTVTVTTDTYYMETSWELVDQCGTGGAASRGDFARANTDYRDTYCLPAARYKFTIRDSFGDGLCCGNGQGSYAVVVEGETQVEGGQFLGQEREHEFGRCAFDTPAPTPPPTGPPTAPPTAPPTSPPTAAPTAPPSTTTSPTLTPSTTASPTLTPEPTILPSVAPSAAPSVVATGCPGVTAKAMKRRVGASTPCPPSKAGKRTKAGKVSKVSKASKISKTARRGTNPFA